MAYTGPSIVDYLNSTGQASDFKSRSALAQQKGIQNYTGTAEQNTQLLGILRTLTPAPQNQAIPATSLGQSTAQPVNATPYNPAPAPAPVQSIEDIMKQYNTPTAQETQYNQKQDSLYGQIESIINKSGQQGARQAELESQQVAPLQKQLNEINSQIGAINASAFKERERAEDRLAPTFAIQGEQAAIERQKSVQTYGLAAAASALTGQVALAQQNVQRALQAEFGGLESQLQYQKLLLDRNKDQLTAIDKKKTQALEKALQQRTEVLAEQKENKNAVYEIMLTASKYGAPNSVLAQIQNATDPGGAIALAGKYLQDPTAKLELEGLRLSNDLKKQQIEAQKIENDANAAGNKTTAQVAGDVVGLLGSGKIGQGTKTGISSILGVIYASEDLAKARPSGEFAGFYPGAGIVNLVTPSGFKRTDTVKNEGYLDAINLKVQQWASGASLTKQQIDQVNRFTPTKNDSDRVVKEKLNNLVNFMNQQIKASLATEGILYDPQPVDLWGDQKSLEEIFSN